jgi:hypothetical protein
MAIISGALSPEQIIYTKVGFSTNDMGWSYVIMKTINYICILILIIYYFISITYIADFTSYLNQQIILLVFIAMAFTADYPNFCSNSASSISSVKKNLHQEKLN